MSLKDQIQILVVDDMSTSRGLIVQALESMGIANIHHAADGNEAIATMVALNRDASEAALAAGAAAATDVTGFGLLGHLYKMCRASGVGAVLDRAAVPVVAGAAASLRAGYVPGGSRRNLDWVRPHLAAGPGIDELDLVLLADAQTSGGLLVAGELPGHPVIGHTTELTGDGPAVQVR